MMCENKFPQNLLDKNGKKINEDDVIFDGKHYFRIYWDNIHSSVEAISPTFGYLRDPNKENYSKYERIGTFQEAESLILAGTN